jgi:hypothetical protein
LGVRTSKSRRSRSQGNREDASSACIIIWLVHHWQSGRSGILNSQNADQAFLAPHLMRVTSYADEAMLKPALSNTPQPM